MKLVFWSVEDELDVLDSFNHELDRNNEAITIFGKDYFPSDILRMVDNNEYLKQFELYKQDKKLGLA
jgi:hypothetical protein